MSKLSTLFGSFCFKIIFNFWKSFELTIQQFLYETPETAETPDLIHFIPKRRLETELTSELDYVNYQNNLTSKND